MHDLIPTAARFSASSDGLSGPWATILSALIALLTALIVSVVTSLLVGRSTDKANKRALTLRRLNEFYAPIKLLLDQDGTLAGQLREGKPDGWHILNHVDEVLADATDTQIAMQIVGVNAKIAAILERRSGLCNGPIPDSFAAFLGHFYMLERAMSGKPFVRNERFQFFPRPFEHHINTEYSKLQADLRRP